MANPNIYAILMVSSLFIALQISGIYAAKEAEEESWIRHLSRGNEKFVKLRFYLQDALGGQNATVYQVAQASITSNSPTSFGQVRVFDDLLTAGPDRYSQELGRAQGMVTSSDFSTEALTTVLNFVFTAGEYSGSAICVLGRNQVDREHRELAVVGGTGAFRFARGYAVETTIFSDEAADYDVQEFTVYASYLGLEADM